VTIKALEFFLAFAEGVAKFLEKEPLKFEEPKNES
jgi:hypothetical protein